MDHPNIVPLLGVTIDPLLLISDWMPCGDLTRYMANNADVNRLGLVRFPLAALRDALTPSPVV